MLGVCGGGLKGVVGGPFIQALIIFECGTKKGVIVNKMHFPALCSMQRDGSDELMHDTKSQQCLCEGT